MNFSSYNSVDFVNGVGTRVSLFLSGCDHKCKGCYNQKTWNPKFGEFFEKKIEDKIISDLNDKIITRDGISLTGGDPLYSENLNSVINLIKRIKSETIDKNIWLWSGYTLDEIESKKNNSIEDILRHQIIRMVDVFIDGKYEKEKKDPTLKWRGSSNQIINYIQLNNLR